MTRVEELIKQARMTYLYSLVHVSTYLFDKGLGKVGRHAGKCILSRGVGRSNVAGNLKSTASKNIFSVMSGRSVMTWSIGRRIER